MVTTIVFMLVIASNVLVSVIAIVTSQAAKHAAARADAAVAEASRATTAALKACADLRKVTNLLLAEVERAQAARSHPRLPPLAPAPKPPLITPEVAALTPRTKMPNGIPVHDFTGEAADAMAKGVSVRAPFVSLAQLGVSEPSSNEFVISPNDMKAILDRRYAA